MTVQHDIPVSKDEVLANIRAARAELEITFTGLDERQMTEPRTEGGWSIKDHLAHIAEWQRRGLGVIAGRPPWEGLGIEKEEWDRLGGTDAINDVLYRRHKDTSLEHVLADFRNTQKQVEQTIESMTDADLQRELPEDISPRFRRVVELANFNFARHDRVHIDDIRALATQR
jgi:uncharacterized damage-inducible protein DinB